MRGSRAVFALLLACFLFFFYGPVWAAPRTEGSPAPADVGQPTNPPPDTPPGTTGNPAPIPDLNPPSQGPTEGVPPVSDNPAGDRRENPTPGQDPSEGSPGGQDTLSATSTSSSTSLSAQDPSENPVVGLIGNVEAGKASGAATSEIPIFSPPGRNGLTPQVVLR